MSINRLNYEEYLADYLDGNLDPVLSAELMVFLSDNPDLEKQYRELESRNHKMPAGILYYPGKENLKKDFTDVKTIDESNFDEFCIAEIEGLLKSDDKQRLLYYIDLHPQRAKDFKLFKHTILRPDLHLLFPGRENLKKTMAIPSRYRFLYYAIRIAAAISAFIMVIAINPGERSGKIDYANVFLKPDIKQDKEAKDWKIINIENKEISRKITAVVEENLIPVRYESETMDVLPYISGIPAALLHNPYLEILPMEKSLYTQPMIPVNTDLIASLPTGKKADSDIPDLLGLVKKVDVWKTAERIVEGFNYLTESRIQLSGHVDDKGKLSDLMITSETFSLISHRNN